jgi:hypothetical protein
MADDLPFLILVLFIATLVIGACCTTSSTNPTGTAASVPGTPAGDMAAAGGPGSGSPGTSTGAPPCGNGGSPPSMNSPVGQGPGNGPGGMGPGSGSGSSSYNLSGAYTVDGTTASQSGQTYTSSTKDLSAIYVTNGGKLTLADPVITTSGDTSSGEASSFYGLNGAVLANNGSSVTITGGTISTTGSGANGVIPTGTGTLVTLKDLKIHATGGGAHGVMATGGATLVLENVDIDTTGGSGAPIATDRGGGTVTVTGGTFISSGQGSPAIYSTGVITVKDAKLTSAKPGAAVIEGSNSITLEDSDLSGGSSTSECVMIYQSFSGDAGVGTGTFTMNGGSLTATGGSLFWVTNTHGVISLKNTKVTTAGTLIKATSSQWGTSGKNGGTVTFTASGETLAGNVTTDSISSADLLLKDGSSLAGTINAASLALDRTSSWTVTGDSVLTGLSDPDGISGTTITNIIGNGHTVTYNAGLAANSALGGKTFSLANGGTLKPS